MSQAARLVDILKPVHRDLERVTDRLMASLQNPVARLAAYLITAGGKRLRPALVLLAGRSGDARAHQRPLLELATAVELVHTATLIHDDIIDEALLRRRQPTFHTRFGTERAVLMGDYLYASAFCILAGIGDSYVTTHMAQVCQQMSRGEFLEVDSRFNIHLTKEEYLQIVRNKTASLIAACCHLGAHVAGATPQTVMRLTDFGWNFGMAFQIMDDCLDLTGEERTLGKTVRSDLEKGLLSLPMIYLAGSMSRQEREQVFAPIRTRRADRAFLAQLAGRARRAGAVTQAIQSAESFVREAHDAVAIQNGVASAQTYRRLARYAIEREE